MLLSLLLAGHRHAALKLLLRVFRQIGDADLRTAHDMRHLHAKHIRIDTLVYRHIPVGFTDVILRLRPVPRPIHHAGNDADNHDDRRDDRAALHVKALAVAFMILRLLMGQCHGDHWIARIGHHGPVTLLDDRNLASVRHYFICGCRILGLGNRDIGGFLWLAAELTIRAIRRHIGSAVRISTIGRLVNNVCMPV